MVQVIKEIKFINKLSRSNILWMNGYFVLKIKSKLLS